MHTTSRLLLVVWVIAAAVLAPPWVAAAPPAETQPAPTPAPGSAPLPSNVKGPEADQVEKRVEQLLAQLTNDEKLDLLAGVNWFYTRGVPRLGIQGLKMTDGPVGTRNDGPSTAYPAGILLAATWNPDLAAREGAALAQDAKARGDQVILGPAVNIYRVPTNGRNFEYFGEDPFLAAAQAVGYIRGMQARGVAACIKHFAANNQEIERGSIDVRVDERALHEIYLPAFRAAVQEAGVWAVMSAYNRVNGPYCTANDYLQNQVLKQMWGFRGLVMSDWGATHDTLGPVNGGLDLEMPGGVFLNRARIGPLLQQGKVTQATVDDKVRRQLRLMASMGFLAPAPGSAPGSVPKGAARSDPSGEAAALDVAREGLVLLKNAGAGVAAGAAGAASVGASGGGGILPLNRETLKRIVVLGPFAQRTAAGGGSSMTTPTHAVSIVDGLKKLAGDKAEVAYVPTGGERDIAAIKAVSRYEASLQTDNKPGLVATYYNGIDLKGPPVATRIETAIDHNWGKAAPLPGAGAGEAVNQEKFSVRWVGRIKAQASGPHAFVLRSDDGSRVLLDGKRIGGDWRNHGPSVQQFTRDLEAGKTYDLTVEYFNNGGAASMEFGWGPQTTGLLADQEQAIAGADTAVVCVGFGARAEGEGFDRPYALPADQVALIQAVARANHKTIVVLHAGGSVDMAPWLDQVAALLHAWYPGQQGGQAIAAVLFGETNPSGKLPITIEKRWEDTPAFGHYPGRGQVEYQEGIFVGYRHYDHANVEPRFPFGFGLSYTTFKLADLKVEPLGAGDARQFRVSVAVTNSGVRAGAEVVQVYVKPVSPSLPRPVRELKGFAKVALQPHATGAATIVLGREAFAHYDPQRQDWVVDPGAYDIEVGSSSRDLPLTERINW